MQTRRWSLIEAVTNMVLGFLISVGLQHLVFKALGYDLPIQTNVVIVTIFTVVSLIRSYCLRRIFNRLH